MYLANVWGFLFIHLGVILMLICYWLMSSALFPGLLEWSRSRYETRPVRSTLLGLVLALPCFLAWAWAMEHGNGALKALGFVVLFTPIVIGLLGSAGLPNLIGARLASPVDAQMPWRAQLRGGVVLAFTFILPLIGPLLLLSLTLISGFGIVLSYMLHRRKTKRTRIDEKPPLLEQQDDNEAEPA